MADILIFAGQSNMQGQAERLSEQKEVVGAWEYKYCADSLLPLHNPVGEDIRVDGRAGWQFSGDGEVKILLDRTIRSAKVGYPLSLSTDFSAEGNTLTVRFTEDFSARFFEIDF